MAKILVVTQHYWPESFRITDLCEGFVEKGHKVQVLCGQPNYPEGEWYPGYGPFKRKKEIHNGVRIRRTFEIKRGNNSYVRIFLNYITFPIATLGHLFYLRRQKFDKIFLYQTSPVMMSLAGIILGKRMKIETTMYVLDLWPQNLYSLIKFKNHLIRKMLQKVSDWHYKSVDRLITVSSRLREYMIENLGRNPEDVIFIPQCCEKLYTEKKTDPKLRERFKDGFNIVFTGNISPLQSFETIIDAAVFLKKDGFEDIRFIIVGDGMASDWLQKEVKKNKLEDMFFFEGFRPKEEIPKYTDIAHVLIACLTRSGLEDFNIPAKVMSYIAAGKPILLAMSGEVRRIISHAECGFTCEAEDAKGLYENIKRVYAMSPKDREVLGKNAESYHYMNFERDQNLEKLLNFILGKA